MLQQQSSPAGTALWAGRRCCLWDTEEPDTGVPGIGASSQGGISRRGSAPAVGLGRAVVSRLGVVAVACSAGIVLHT